MSKFVEFIQAQHPVLSILEILGLFVAAASLRYYTQVFRYRDIPTVWPALPFLGDAYSFLFNPISYIEQCRVAYGPIFRCLLGNRRVVVICDSIGIQAILRDKTRVLSTHYGYRGVGAAIADVDTDVCHYLPDRLLPLTAEILSGADLPQLLPELNRLLYAYVERTKAASDNPQVIPLSHFVGESLYSAVSTALFGKVFPTTTFPDFADIDSHFVHLITCVPFLTMSARRARARLLETIASYIDMAGISPDMGMVPESAAKILSVLNDLPLLTSDRSGMLLLFMWGLHSSTIRAAFWLFAHLLNNPAALQRIRAEIDHALDAYASIDSLLDAPPGTLDGPEFSLLNSAVKEAIRASFVVVPMREVCEDMMVTLGTGQSYPLRKGELVAVNIPGLHRDPGSHYNPLEYQVDRFLIKDDKRSSYLPWGGGEHVCKGRFLAQHLLKMLLILVLRSSDLSIVDASGQPRHAPFLTDQLSYMQLWQMRSHTPLHIRLRRRYASGPQENEMDCWGNV